MTDVEQHTMAPARLTDLLADLTERGVQLRNDGGHLGVRAPRHVLTDRDRELLRKHRTELLALLGDEYPATAAQHRMWLAEQLDPDVPVHNLYFAVRLTGHLDADRLRAAVADLVRRHQTLRTTFHPTPGGLVQRVAAAAEVPFETESVLEQELDRQVLAETARPFALDTAPLIRLLLLTLGPDRAVLVVTVHHIAADGWSMAVIRRELTELYAAHRQGRAAELPEQPWSYLRYADQERRWLASPAAERQRTYWRDRLAGLPRPADLVPGRLRPTTATYAGGSVDFTHGLEVLEPLRAACTQAGVTLYTGLLAALGIVLARMSRSDDLAVGTPVSHRPDPALEGTVGLFVNTLALRLRPSADLTVREYVRQVRSTLYQSMDHQQLPFDQVVDAVDPAGGHGAARPSPFRAALAMQNYRHETLALDGLSTEAYPVPIYSSQLDFTLNLQEGSDHLEGQFVYNLAALSAQDAESLQRWYATVLRKLPEALDARIDTLSLTDADDDRVLAAVNDTLVPYRHDTTVHRLIAERLGESPDLPAVTFRGRTLTRAELDLRSRAVAAALTAAQLPPGSRIAVLVPRSTDLPAVLLGVLRAGMSYVPLDGAMPEQRMVGILADAECAALISAGPIEHALPGFEGARLHLTELAQADPGVADHAGAPSDPAYTIFTSGSTGRPKGVSVTHRNVLNLFAALDQVLPLPGTPRWLAVTNVTFDISVLELLWTLARGIPVVLAENLETLRAQDTLAGQTVIELLLAGVANAMQATPTLLRNLLAAPEGERALGRLDLLLVGGEALAPELARRLTAAGTRHVVNMYGPTETTVWSTYWPVPAEPESVRVGTPLANTRVHVLDHTGQPAPTSMFGELVIAGDGVAEGYFNRPELTAEKFPGLPALDGGRKVYRTGDLARILPDGQLELLGRTDNQVKVNGHRIELEEIEHVLNADPAVRAAVVTVRQTASRSYLAAHCVPAGVSFDPRAITERLRQVLPPDLVPAVLVRLNELPTTLSGKVDRPAAAMLPAEPSARPSGTAPEGPLEGDLLALWRRVLGQHSIGVEDDFFDAGGNSILVTRLLSELHGSVAPQARISDLFTHRTVRAYARHLAADAAAETRGDDARQRSRARAAQARQALARNNRALSGGRQPRPAQKRKES
ncbi:amino acid adenylation domain-containing protein [Streptomyces sp. NPDC040750]|uniref:non-ribosomal peptide synthetase n=1 Tax=Streptomyces sp. NPDC040750 TaxID=3154491 RepID=UPI0033C2DF8E